MWLIAGNNIPQGHKVRHVVCNDDKCINPEHMTTGTQRENIQDMLDIGRGRPRLGIDVLVCQRGHDCSLPQQVRVRKREDGGTKRLCRRCERERDTESRLRRKAEKEYRDWVLTTVEQSSNLFAEPNGEAA